ncbi:hypothetical protein NIES4102_37110 [Chondrocystis sp. NIES-4102]|nr:hypothetical protein NIES4102_37110 [Chondrocystis sp. NIES-4102]
MNEQLIKVIKIAGDLLSQSNNRIAWNLFLAFIPLGISYYLFKVAQQRNFIWWLIALIFLAFLPNASYILTDSIHIIELSANYPTWATICILIPQYTLFIIAGFEAYVISLSWLNDYLINNGLKKYTIVIQAIAHCLCVLGIYLGRFERFNSWDLVTMPVTVLVKTAEDLFDLWKILTLAIAFLIVWLLAEFTGLINSKFMGD